MNLLRSFATCATVAVCLMGFAAPAAHAVTIDWVTVGDPGNAADTTTYGAVADAFQIMKFEFTNAQYADFLNAVDPSGTNPNAVYNVIRRAKTGHSSAPKTGHRVGGIGWKNRLVRSCWQGA